MHLIDMYLQLAESTSLSIQMKFKLVHIIQNQYQT